MKPVVKQKVLETTATGTRSLRNPYHPQGDTWLHKEYIDGFLTQKSPMTSFTPTGTNLYHRYKSPIYAAFGHNGDSTAYSERKDHKGIKCGALNYPDAYGDSHGRPRPGL